MEHASPLSPEERNDLVGLLRRAQAGSAEAARFFFDRCREPLLAVIRRVIIPPLRRLYDSDDFLVDTLAFVFSRHFSDEVLQSPETLLLYLKRIAENKVRDATRKYLLSERYNLRRDVSLDSLNTEEGLPSRDLSPEDVLMLKELVEERLDDLIHQLPIMLQHIVVLILRGHNGLQIAHRLHVDPKRVYRAIAWLKRKILEN